MWCIALFFVSTTGDSILVLYLMLFLLLCGVLGNFFVVHRMTQRITQGHYREGGKGFFEIGDNKMQSWNSNFSFILRSIGIPTLISVIASSRLLSNDFALPAVAVLMIMPLLPLLLFFVFAFVNATFVMNIYCIRHKLIEPFAAQ
jgi:hypothetical protein